MHSAARHDANYYATPELAAHYDADHADRADFRFYRRLAQDLGSVRVIDIGCGTGLLCSQLAGDGYQIIGVDPQPTMLDIATGQPNAATVRWINGTADDLPSEWADLVIMTGHVAQYFLSDADWRHVLVEARRSLRPNGSLAFEIRNHAVEAWRTWTTGKPKPTAGGTIELTVHVEGDLVTHTGRWVQGERIWTTTETLRFPSWEAMTAGLSAAGLTIVESWGDFAGGPLCPDSPEWIILARPALVDRGRAAVIATRTPRSAPPAPRR